MARSRVSRGHRSPARIRSRTESSRTAGTRTASGATKSWRISGWSLPSSGNAASSCLARRQSALCSKAALRRSTPKSHSFITSTLSNSVNGLGDGPASASLSAIVRCRAEFSPPRLSGQRVKKCRGHLLGNMPERGGQNRDQFILEEWDRLERRIFHQTQERHRRATRSAQGYFHFM